MVSVAARPRFPEVLVRQGVKFPVGVSGLVARYQEVSNRGFGPIRELTLPPKECTNRV